MKKEELEKDEVLDSLEIKDYKIIQREKGFKFGIDSCLLANLALDCFEQKYKKTKNYIFCDMCSGTGVVANIFYSKHLLIQEKEIDKNVKGLLLEIDKKAVESAQKTIRINEFEQNLLVRKCDIKKINKIKLKEDEELKEFLAIKQRVSKQNLSEIVDILLVNPPYFKSEKGLKNKENRVFTARSEKECSFSDVANAAAFLLKNSASLYVVHKTERLSEIINTLKKYKLEPKEITFIHSFVDRESQNFILCAVKNGKEGIKVNKPLIIYEKEGVYTKEVLTLLNK